MNSYEIESKLRDKADKWQFHNLESKISTLENQNVQLQREIGNCEGRINTHMRAIETLINFIIEKNLLPEYENSLHELKQYL